MTIAPGLEEAARVARSRARLIRSTTKGGSAIAIGLEDLAQELDGMARRAQARTTKPDLLTSPAAAPAQAAE
ncbi:hypothetical protein SAMN02982917_2341 [Azospirillum oryzae]|uniref:Uncharacterized protein n=1 Tax=Azospirillum oryzae TaxID=286727 RepID=A0A1X7F8E5_9PROT|nr:hypothetical protein [Azospirillum oryzae]SMF47759.1 hypothetical protein SAMN02982917_2341 [Azospirillum oryzae]